jgi:NADPH-dependent curcumin reductase CurA
MLERGQIRSLIYGIYGGLESVPRALEDLAARKVSGKAIIDLSTQQLLQSRM